MGDRDQKELFAKRFVPAEKGSREAPRPGQGAMPQGRPRRRVGEAGERRMKKGEPRIDTDGHGFGGLAPSAPDPREAPQRFVEGTFPNPIQ